MNRILIRMELVPAPKPEWRAGIMAFSVVCALLFALAVSFK